MKMTPNRLMVAAVLAGLLCGIPLTRAADSAAPASKPAAGQRGEPGARARDRMQQVAKELNLTDEQKAQLKPVLQKEADKLKALRDDTSLSREQRREKVQAIRADIAAEAKKVLTAEQYEKWQKMREQRQRRGGPDGQGGPNTGAPPKKSA